MPVTPRIDPPLLLTCALSSVLNAGKSHSWRCEVDTQPPHDTAISNQRTTFWHISSTPEGLCRLKCPHSCSVGTRPGHTHTHTHVQCAGWSDVSCEKWRWKVTLWCQIRHGFESGPLGARSDTLEGHVFPSPHLRRACEPHEILSPPYIPLPPPQALAEKGRREWEKRKRERESVYVCVCERERESKRQREREREDFTNAFII